MSPEEKMPRRRRASKMTDGGRWSEEEKMRREGKWKKEKRGEVNEDGRKIKGKKEVKEEEDLREVT
jgi:hypothetical protein